MSYVRTLAIRLLVVYFMSAAGCHCFDLPKCFQTELTRLQFLKKKNYRDKKFNSQDSALQNSTLIIMDLNTLIIQTNSLKEFYRVSATTDIKVQCFHQSVLKCATEKDHK